MRAWAAEEGVDQDALRERITEAADRMMAEKEAAFGAETMRNIEKQVLLQSIDGKWREHLLKLEHLRSVVGFRGYAQRDPLNEYKTEGFTLFEHLLESLREEVSQKLSAIRPMSAEESQAMMQNLLAQRARAPGAAAPASVGEALEGRPASPALAPPALAMAAAGPAGLAPADGVQAEGVQREGFVEGDPATWGAPARNDPCPCGSGRKFKHCHGAY